MFRKALSLASILAFSTLIPLAANTPATADPCVGDWSIVMGGFTLSGPGVTGEDSGYLIGNQRVGYNSADPAGGLNELNRLYWQHRGQCPGDHIRLMGHSEGAAIVHQWVENNQGARNTNAILLADPKRAPGPGSGGLSGSMYNGVVGYPLRGTDASFGGVPVLTVCNWSDVICEDAAGWFGYLFQGAHAAYDFNAFDYGDWDRGVWMR